MKDEDIKKVVKKSYADIAKQSSSCCAPRNNPLKANSCCGAPPSASDISRKMGYSEDELSKLPEGANLGLGCGNPVALASLNVGDTYLDLGSGAGIDCSSEGTVTITNCTVAGNVAGRGGGISCYPLAAVGDCIFWGNSDSGGVDESAQIDATTHGDPVINYNCIQGLTGALGGTGNIGGDPDIVSLGYWVDVNDPNIVVEPNDPNAVWVDGDYHLLEGSPCIDAGDPNYIAGPNETDLDGRPRVIGGRIDMGAYEYNPPIPAEVRIVPRSINSASRGNWITCYIWLPEDYDVADIDPNSVFLEDEIQAQSFVVYEQEQVAMVRFSRSEVQGILAPGEVELTVSGKLTDRTIFEGKDVITLIDKGSKK